MGTRYAQRSPRHPILGARFSRPWLRDGRWVTYDNVAERTVEEHKALYEHAHGEIAGGMIVHHIDGDPTNNDLSNLEAIDQRTHMRKHAGWKIIDGVWHKTCAGCRTLLPEDRFTLHHFDGRSVRRSRCNSCRAQDNRRYKLARGEG